jgi:transmembrane sensor
MTDVMNNDIDKKTLEYFLTDLDEENTSVEQLERERWLRENPQQQDQLDQLEQQWSEVESLAPWAHEEIERLESNLGLTQVPDQGKVSPIRYYLKWLSVPLAAAALLLVFITLPIIQQDDPLYYETTKGEQRKLILPDGSRVSLNSDSAIEVTFTTQARDIRLLKGEGLFEVVHEQSRPFVVTARENQVVAVGTVFNVRFDHEDITVTVLEGKVAVVPTQDNKLTTNATLAIENLPDQPSGAGLSSGVLLELGRQIRVSRHGVIAAPQEVHADNVTAWNRGMMIFDGVSLREVAREMSRYIDGDIQVDDAVANHLVTGGIKISDRDTMLGLLLEVVPIQLVNKNPKLTILIEYTAAKN